MDVKIRFRDVEFAVFLEAGAYGVDLTSASALAIDTLNVHTTEFNLFNTAGNDKRDHTLLEVTSRREVGAKYLSGSASRGVAGKAWVTVVMAAGLEVPEM